MVTKARLVQNCGLLSLLILHCVTLLWSWNHGDSRAAGASLKAGNVEPQTLPLPGREKEPKCGCCKKSGHIPVCLSIKARKVNASGHQMDPPHIKKETGQKLIP